MVDAVLYSSKSEEWETPQDLFDQLNAQFSFTLDAAATAENAKCEEFLTREDDALAESTNWPGTVWLNPPYGRGLYSWIEKAWWECMGGSTVVMLLPSRTDTQWFHDFIYNKAEVIFLRGRLKFSGNKNAAPFPSMIVVFRPRGK